MIGTCLNQVLADELAFFVISPEKDHDLVSQEDQLHPVFRQISLFVMVSSVRHMQLCTL